MRIIILLILFFYTIFAKEIILNEKQTTYLTNKKVITMCVDPDWEPFEKINKNGIHEGISADIIKLISTKLDIKIELIPTKDWDESIEFSKQKKCDILSFLNETPKRKEWLVFTEPVFTDSNVLVGRSERSYIEDISKENLSIALPRNTAMSERFAKDFPNLVIIPTSSEDEAFKLVEEQKADLTLRSMIIAAYTIKKNGIFNLKIIGEPKGYENNLRIGVRLDEPILKDILNEAIKTITQKDIDDIVNKYVTIVIEKTTTFTIALWILAVLSFVIFIILLWNYMLNLRVKKEIKKNEEQQQLLIEQKRKAEIGELLGNISHQWKNGLSQISSLNLEMLLMYKLNQNINDNKEFYQRLQDTENSIKFMIETMNTFLGYYKEESDYSKFKVEENIRQVKKLIDLEIKKSNLNINIISNFPLEITANKNQWLHVWLNLISNSIKASKLQNIKNPQINITINEKNITYEDNCGGFKAEVLEDIQKHKQKGLGLKMSLKIVERSNYFMNIENYNSGVKFTIFKK
ncbi:MAG: transporter substrate-binding domain-containing protein [Arcobacter sp.]|jgi:ABC-type amino acid transport substrate-binding protein|uniref:transporter substrate-binding domain-containing protein n=1 Tax=Arcobacter sp. TaxID=1872629 RepID=UPI002A76247F|nr:transporter substrate-binding domain-containing protein [Arcobacter sp.]MDY3205014.1 transporter substrate-binding domain-containing protein [Arcobacter sp.]